MNPTNKSVEIKLNNGKTHALFFDLNTFYEFEQKSGKTLTSFLVELEQAFMPVLLRAAKSARKNGKPDPELARENVAALSRIQTKDIRALIWAALHEYDKDGEPRWPYSIGKLGGLIDNSNLAESLNQLMTGVSNSLPRAKKDEKAEDKSDRPFENSVPQNGGNESGSSDEEILASMTPRSEG